MNTMSATEFKAKCLEVLDRLAAHEIEELTITKRGRPVALVTAPKTTEKDVRNLSGFMRGLTIIPKGFDLTAPVLDEPLDAESGILHR
jgi:prevent-host-death family protein